MASIAAWAFVTSDPALNLVPGSVSIQPTPPIQAAAPNSPPHRDDPRLVAEGQAHQHQEEVDEVAEAEHQLRRIAEVEQRVGHEQRVGQQREVRGREGIVVPRPVQARAIQAELGIAEQDEDDQQAVEVEHRRPRIDEYEQHHDGDQRERAPLDREAPSVTLFRRERA